MRRDVLSSPSSLVVFWWEFHFTIICIGFLVLFLPRVSPLFARFLLIFIYQKKIRVINELNWKFKGEEKLRVSSTLTHNNGYQ